MTRRMRLGVGLTLAGVLAMTLGGCGSEELLASDSGAATEALARSLRLPAARSTTPAGPPQLTRAVIEKADFPLALGTIESLNATAIMGRISQNSGTETYASADRVTVTLRDGVMISSRGFRADLMSGIVPSGATIRSGTGSHDRVHDYLDSLDKIERHRFACTLAKGGVETITIAQTAYRTSVVTETCSGSTGSFANQYWIESSGKIRQSRQWISETVGFLRLSLAG